MKHDKNVFQKYDICDYPVSNLAGRRLFYSMLNIRCGYTEALNLLASESMQKSFIDWATHRTMPIIGAFCSDYLIYRWILKKGYRQTDGYFFPPEFLQLRGLDSSLFHSP